MLMMVIKNSTLLFSIHRLFVIFLTTTLFGCFSAKKRETSAFWLQTSIVSEGIVSKRFTFTDSLLVVKAGTLNIYVIPVTTLTYHAKLNKEGEETSSVLIDSGKIFRFFHFNTGDSNGRFYYNLTDASFQVHPSDSMMTLYSFSKMNFALSAGEELYKEVKDNEGWVAQRVYINQHPADPSYPDTSYLNFGQKRFDSTPLSILDINEGQILTCYQATYVFCKTDTISGKVVKTVTHRMTVEVKDTRAKEQQLIQTVLKKIDSTNQFRR